MNSLIADIISVLSESENQVIILIKEKKAMI